MSATEELLKKIDSGAALFYWNILDFDVEELVQLLGPRIIQTSGKNYAIAMHREDPTDCSDRTEYFDWHSDGLYHPTPPKFVLLHCLNSGNGQIHTDLADVQNVLAKLSPDRLQTLSRLCSHYIGHGGNFDHRILLNNKILLASRGYVSPLTYLPLEEQPSIRDIGEALSELYLYLDCSAVSYKWRAGDTLIFNQYQYLHRRNSAVIDRDRKLIRMWFT